MARRGVAGQGRLGTVRHGSMWCGEAGRLGAVRPGMARKGRQGMNRPGWMWHGQIIFKRRF